MTTIRRRNLAPAVAAAALALGLAGCGSHHDNTDPNLHGAGPTQDNPAPAAVTDTGNHSGATTTNSLVPGATPNSMGNSNTSSNTTTSNVPGGSTTTNGATTSNGNSTSTRATPGGAGFLPSNTGGGTGSVLGTNPRP
jgi:hypothetical protein